MQQEVWIGRCGKRKQPRQARFSLTALAPRPGAPAAITVTVQLGRNGWTRVVTVASAAEFAAALAPDVAHLARDVRGRGVIATALANIVDAANTLSNTTTCAARSIDPAKVILTANAGQQGARP